ncbi:MAG: endonuclease/exonuclease/phosphatase family protein [Alphaproteobacteria bacterium]
MSGADMDSTGKGAGPFAVSDTVVASLPDCPKGQRALFAALPYDPALHARAQAALPLFHAIEVHASNVPASNVPGSNVPGSNVPATGRSPAPAPDRLRVAAWNLERCYHPDAVARVLAREGADVALLTEVDVGMARTGQNHTPRRIAGPLGHDCLYAVEFLELSLGSKREETLFAGETNARGFHGNAITSGVPVGAPRLIRFDDLATWFPEDCDERRIGGRMALATTLSMGGRTVVVACAHLEVRVHSSVRARQMAVLLDTLEAWAPGAPMIVGGDFNTTSDSWSLGKGVAAGTPEWAVINARTKDPVAYEPLFAEAAARGFSWGEANAPGRTTRETPQSGPRRYPDLRLDWFFVRGLTVEHPRTVPALDDEGKALSDHELILVDVRF